LIPIALAGTDAEQPDRLKRQVDAERHPPADIRHARVAPAGLACRITAYVSHWWRTFGAARISQGARGRKPVNSQYRESDVKRILTITFVVMMAITTGLPADAYPEKPVKLIVPAKPGGALDIVTRLVAAQLEEKFGVPFPVVNVTGGASAIGIRQADEAEPNGYTILVIHQQMLVIGASGLLGFDPLQRFDGVGQTGLMENYLVTYRDAPFSTISELKAYSAAHPGMVKAGVNIGGLGHLVMVQIEDGLNADFNYVNVPGGGAPKLKSLLGAFTDVAILGRGKFAGRSELVPLAVLADERTAGAPEIPSAGEEGFPARFQLAFWWMMGKDVPAEAKSVIEQALAEIMADESVQREFVDRGIDAPVHLNAAETAASLQKQMIDYTASVAAIAAN